MMDDIILFICFTNRQTSFDKLRVIFMVRYNFSPETKKRQWFFYHSRFYEFNGRPCGIPMYDRILASNQKSVNSFLISSTPRNTRYAEIVAPKQKSVNSFFK